MPTVKKLSYAGITLPLTPSFLEEQWLRIVHDQYSYIYADFWNFEKPNSQALPTPNLPVPPSFSLGKLTWPTGASCPAFFHTIIERNRWENHISPLCSPDGYNTPQPLMVFDSRPDKTITASMYICGAARPLNQLGNPFNDLMLLTLTDQRFYWYYNRANISNPLTWTALYDQLASALGITISLDTISPNYGAPSSKWNLAYQASTNTILDAAAANVGQRVVVGLDGTVKTVNWQTARAASNAYTTSSNILISGGLIEEAAIAKSVPSSVQTLFPDKSTGTIVPIPIVVNNTLTSLSISEYGTSPGLPGYIQTIYGDTEYNGSNMSALNDYAAQAASDWYGWQLVDTDLVYPGIEPWIPTGWEDSTEWALKLISQNPALPLSDGDDPYTKTQIHRGPWTSIPSGNFYNPGGSSTVTNYPTLYIQQVEDGEDAVRLPGTKGDTGPAGKSARDGAPGQPGEEAEYTPVVPGLRGLRGFTGIGIPGIPGRDGDEAEYTPIVKGERGSPGANGRTPPAIPGRDGDDAEYTPIVPGLIGLRGYTGTGQPGPPGRDGEDDDKPIVQIVQNIVGNVPIYNGSGVTQTLSSGGTWQDISFSTKTIVAGIYLLGAGSEGHINLTTPGSTGNDQSDLQLRLVVTAGSLSIVTSINPIAVIVAVIGPQQLESTNSGGFTTIAIATTSVTYKLQGQFNLGSGATSTNVNNLIGCYGYNIKLG